MNTIRKNKIFFYFFALCITFVIFCSFKKEGAYVNVLHPLLSIMLIFIRRRSYSLLRRQCFRRQGC